MTALRHDRARRPERRARRPLFLIDLAVPRDFEPAINLFDDVFLYDIDDLQSIAQAHLRERQTEISRSVEILKPHVDRYVAWADRQIGVGGLVDPTRLVTP